MPRSDEAPEGGAHDAEAPPDPRGALRTLAELVLAPALGAVLGYVALTTWVLDHVELGNVQRIVETARFLERDAPSGRWAAFIGHSVMRDGIDGSLVDETAPAPLRSANLALGGFDLNEHRVVLPKLLAHRPRFVVVGLSPTTGCYLDRIPPDKAYAYALASFVAAWPADRSEEDFFRIAPESYRALRSTPFEQRLHFRTVLVNAFDRELRARLRSNLRADYMSDFVHPYQYLGSVSPQVLEKHLDDTRRSIEHCARVDPEVALASFFGVLGDIRAAGAKPVVLVYPIHPRLRAAAEPFLRQVRPRVAEALARDGGVLVDASDLLEAPHFADAVHPNETGRARLSRSVGRGLPAG